MESSSSCVLKKVLKCYSENTCILSIINSHTDYFDILKMTYVVA